MARATAVHPDAPRLSRRRLAAAAALLLSGCAQPSAAPTPATPADADARALAAERALGVWRLRLAEHVASAGQGDPAVLAELPALHSPASLRPTQITFGVTDIDAIEAGRDGCDAVGLMVGRHSDATGIAYVFVVGVIERQAQRPVALIDVRAVAMSLRQGEATWITGPADADALALYERRRGEPTVLRFPAMADQFVLATCDARPCVEERNSGARWALY